MSVDPHNSELEKKSLEFHVDMSRQRYAMLSEKVETLDERFDAFMKEFSDFRKEHADSMAQLREENTLNTQSTNKIFVGAAATVIAGLLSTLVVLVVAFL